MLRSQVFRARSSDAAPARASHALAASPPRRPAGWRHLAGDPAHQPWLTIHGFAGVLNVRERDQRAGCGHWAWLRTRRSSGAAAASCRSPGWCRWATATAAARGAGRRSARAGRSGCERGDTGRARCRGACKSGRGALRSAKLACWRDGRNRPRPQVLPRARGQHHPSAPLTASRRCNQWYQTPYYHLLSSSPLLYHVMYMAMGTSHRQSALQPVVPNPLLLFTKF